VTFAESHADMTAAHASSTLVARRVIEWPAMRAKHLFVTPPPPAPAR
jgi:hypothetical protein